MGLQLDNLPNGFSLATQSDDGKTASFTFNGGAQQLTSKEEPENKNLLDVLMATTGARKASIVYGHDIDDYDGTVIEASLYR